jgi:hypothetical protein
MSLSWPVLKITERERTESRFYLLMSQDDLFKNQVIEEILRERSSSYILQGKPNDFWILVSPKFIEKEEIQQQIKQNLRMCL